ncbi:hypothetical protein GP486_005358, partial [Trichoglossum hirsutum]
AVVRLLIEKGADVNAKKTSERREMMKEAEYGGEIEVDSGVTALHLAAENGHEAVVRLLIEKGADVNAEKTYRWNEGETALHLAAENGHEAVARLLTKKGADANAKKEEEGCSGKTALQRAARYRDEEAMRLATLLTRNL